MIALWRGWLPSVIGVIPYVGLNFAVYETLKEVVLRYHGACKGIAQGWMMRVFVTCRGLFDTYPSQQG